MAHIAYVDADDNVIGAGSKAEALEKGIIHRIVRIFLFNPRGEILMQKRAEHLKSGPGLWDQSVGGHVDEGETYLQAAMREMEEEIGVTGIELKELTKYYFETKRKRFNTLYTGVYDGEICLNPDEASESRWTSPQELEDWTAKEPEKFVRDFIHAFALVKGFAAS